LMMVFEYFMAVDQGEFKPEVQHLKSFKVSR